MHISKRFPIERARTLARLKLRDKTEPIKVVENLPAKFLSDTLKKPWLRLNVFLEDGPLARTPEYYKKFIYEWKVVTPSPVHYVPPKDNWVWQDGKVVPERDFPLPLTIPNELHQGLWGGEAIIKGYEKRYKLHEAIPKYWVPKVNVSVVYSEILDKYLRVNVTERALSLIDEHHGLDNYILKTPPADLMSQLALKLKRQMLLALVRGSVYPDDPEKKERILSKYEEFIIPEEEADWIGLDLKEASQKQLLIEKEEARPVPYKLKFRQEFIQYLKQQEEKESQEKSPPEVKEGVLTRWSTFGKRLL